jgi:hypothetical protein
MMDCIKYSVDFAHTYKACILHVCGIKTVLNVHVMLMEN